MSLGNIVEGTDILRAQWIGDRSQIAATIKDLSYRVSCLVRGFVTLSRASYSILMTPPPGLSTRAILPRLSKKTVVTLPSGSVVTS